MRVQYLKPHVRMSVSDATVRNKSATVHTRSLTHGDRSIHKYCSRNITRPIRRKYYCGR